MKKRTGIKLISRRKRKRSRLNCGKTEAGMEVKNEITLKEVTR
jgi:hypothetical protein